MRFLFSCVLIFLLSVSLAFGVTVQEVKPLVESSDKRALSSADALVKAEPKNAEAWVLLARARMQNNQAEQAITAAEKATKLSPGNSQAYFWLGLSYSTRIGQVGMFSQMSMAPKLRDAFEKAVALDGNNLDAREALVQFYLQAPAVVGGGKDKASVQVAEISKRDTARGHMARAQVFMNEKNSAAAMKSYEAAYALKPADKNIRMALGVGYQTLERWNDAFKHFRSWVTQDQKAAGAWYQIGRTSAISGLQLQEGIDALQKYLLLPIAQNDPPKKNAHYRLGQLYTKLGKKVEAKSAFLAALKLDPKFADAKTELAKL